MKQTAWLHEAVSFIGSDIGDPYSSIAEWAPRSARLVAAVSWSWSPAHNRISEYRISTDRSRDAWHLYEISESYESGKRICCRVASGTPYAGVADKTAAYQLLSLVWSQEMQLFESDPGEVTVDKAGLLGEREVAALALEVSSLSRFAWWQQQSPMSLEALRKQLSWPLDQATQTLMEEIESGADELALPKDFLELCRRYDLERPHLVSLHRVIVKDAEIAYGDRRRQAAINVERFRRQIDVLIADFSDSKPHHFGGRALPSKRESVKRFLEEFVAKHAKLPTGMHKAGQFGPEVDFDSLRRKHGL